MSDDDLQESPVDDDCLQPATDEKASVEELEQLLAKSAQWGQYLVQRNDDLEAENARLRASQSAPAAAETAELEGHLSHALLQVEELTDKVRQVEAENVTLQGDLKTIREAAKEEIALLAPSLGGSGGVADWLVEYALGKVEDRHWRSKYEAEQERAQQLQARSNTAETQLAALAEESCHMQQQVASFQEQVKRGAALAQETQAALEAERGETSALRAEASRLRQQLDDRIISEFSSPDKSQGHENDGVSSLAAELSGVDGSAAGMSLATELDMLPGNRKGEVHSSPVSLARSDRTQLAGADLLAECERLRSKVEHGLSGNGKSLVNGTHEPLMPEPVPVAVLGLRNAVNAMLCELGALRELARMGRNTDEVSSSLIVGFDALGNEGPEMAGFARDVTSESSSSLCDDSAQSNPERQELQRECKQLHKEVESAVEWVRRARRTTEAKRGMLNLHGALATRTENSPVNKGAPQFSAAEVKRLQQAVVRAAEAEREAYDLLAAKQELLAEHETRLRESDKSRLDQVVSSVVGSLNLHHTNLGAAVDSPISGHGTGVNSTGGAAVWHVMCDDATP